MEINRLIIDASSIVKACLFAGKDAEFGRYVIFEDKKHFINSAEWGFENFVASWKKVMEDHRFAPYQTVLVLDGRNGNSLRRNIWPGYKAKRKPSPPEFFEEYSELLEGVVDEVTALGGICCWQDFMEADDIIAYLAGELDGRKMVWSRDGDMLVLKSESVDVLLNDVMNPTSYKTCPDTKYITLFKALVGDTSDNFPGARGFGEGAFRDLAIAFGAEGLDEITRLIKERKLHELEESVADFPRLQKIIDSSNDVLVAWALASFYVDRVNTSADPLQVRMQVIRDAAQIHQSLRHFGGTKTLAGVEDSDWILKEIEKGSWVGLDIETDTCAESKAWAQKIIDASKGRKKVFVDVMGSELCGLSLTFGENHQHTVYLGCRHKSGNKWTSEQICDLVSAIPATKTLIVHNFFFEGPVLMNEWGGWLEGAVDTALMSSWANENLEMGLKKLSKHYLNYEQVTYEQVVGEKSGMFELTTDEVFDYGCDDTICTSALYSRLRFTLELENTWEAFNAVDAKAMYPVAESFYNGIVTDPELIEQMKEEDLQHYQAQWEFVEAYLLGKGWAGSATPRIELTPAGVKQAFQIVTGEPLDCRARKWEKLVEAVREQGASELADVLESGGVDEVQAFVDQHFEPQVEFNANSPVQMTKLLYEVMGAGVRVRNPVTKKMREAGVREGTPATDASAFDHGIKFDFGDDDERSKVLLAIREMKSVTTRTSLFYDAWPNYTHWRTGKIHANPGMSRAATRRATPNSPNYAQLAKKGEGKKVRKMIKAPKGYLVCPMDLEGQELKLCATVSQDKNLLACYIGDNLLDPHSLTGSGIAARSGSELGDYELFIKAVDAEEPEAKKFRSKGKNCNFATQFGAQAKRLAQMLVVTESEAQVFIDAKNEKFPGILAWQEEAEASAKRLGYAKTLLGARRHLQEQLDSDDSFIRGKAARQAANFEIQASASEQLKQSVGQMADSGLFEDMGAWLVGLIHDEAVAYIPLANAVDCIMLMHSCMVRQYADMPMPARSSVAIGWNFGETISIGTDPTREQVEEAIKKLLTT